MDIPYLACPTMRTCIHFSNVLLVCSEVNTENNITFFRQPISAITVPDEAPQTVCGLYYFLFLHIYIHGVQRRMISMDNFFVFLRIFFFALLLLNVT